MQRLGALEGITVLDLTRVLAGPFSSMMMADMGANVIKLRRPEREPTVGKWGLLKMGKAPIT